MSYSAPTRPLCQSTVTPSYTSSSTVEKYIAAGVSVSLAIDELILGSDWLVDNGDSGTSQPEPSIYTLMAID